MPPIFGLDFGTSNSALSINVDGRVEVLKIDDFNPDGKTMRSILFFDDEKNVFVGQEALDRYAEGYSVGRYLQSLKAFLPDANFTDTEIFGKKHTLEELVAIILAKMKRKGETLVGQSINKAIFGRPVVFSEDGGKDDLAQTRLKTAAELAGFTEIVFQFEPIAAALAYESIMPAGREKIALIGDFGGGTSDFTIMRTRGGVAEWIDRKEDVLALSGVYIGGDTFDSRIMWEKVAWHYGKNVRIKMAVKDDWMPMPLNVIGKIKKWNLIPQLNDYRIRENLRQCKRQADKPELLANLEQLIDFNYGLFLFRAIEGAKRQLSNETIAEINFRALGLWIQELILREEFEEYIEEDLFKIEGAIEQALLSAGLQPKQIDVVFLTGGSSFIPAIRQIFTNTFGLEKVNYADAFTSVVYGLGLSANWLF